MTIFTRENKKPRTCHNDPRLNLLIVCYRLMINGDYQSFQTILIHWTKTREKKNNIDEEEFSPFELTRGISHRRSVNDY